MEGNNKPDLEFLENGNLYKELNEVMLENYFQSKAAEKVRKGLRRRVIPFAEILDNRAMKYWDDRFYKGFISYGNFMQIVEQVTLLSSDVKDIQQQNNKFKANKFILKLMTFLVVITILIIVGGVAATKDAQQDSIITFGIVAASISILLGLANALHVFFAPNNHLTLVSKKIANLTEFIVGLNRDYEKQGLIFKFDIQLMNLDIVKNSKTQIEENIESDVREELKNRRASKIRRHSQMKELIRLASSTRDPNN